MTPRLISFLALCLPLALAGAAGAGDGAATTRAMAHPSPATTWTPDNGNGTYTNPLFHDEFSDPDVIRVGDDFYLAGTTMHAMPCLVVLHSKDLVNWEFLSYAADQLDLGPGFRLEEGKEIYGQGIWAPCIRFHDGTFYLFSNINQRGLQVFTSKNPAGPWHHHEFDRMIHDISVLFDDDGRVYAISGYDEVRIVELKKDITGVIEGTDRVLIPKGNAMGEGHHLYKIRGKYFIISADYSPVGRMQCARADSLNGPWETVVISSRETMGWQRGWGLAEPTLGRAVPAVGSTFTLTPPGANEFGAVPLHQGGIVDLPNGDWWGISMMDFKSVGRTIFLSPVTWTNDWPYFGLAGNLGRSPRTWVKPAVKVSTEPRPTYQRDDDFSSNALMPLWQWNHAPDKSRWSLSENPGFLRLHTAPAKDFLWARNSLTQRAIGPKSTATAVLDGSQLKPGDYAGLGVLNIPFATIGLARTNQGLAIRWHDQTTNQVVEIPSPSPKISLRVAGDFEQDIASLSYSTDGERFITLGKTVRLPFQLKTFQGVRLALFAFNTEVAQGGYADFDSFTVTEPLADRSRNLPLGKVITLTNLGSGKVVWAGQRRILHSADLASNDGKSSAARFHVLDRGLGRVALEAVDGGGFITVAGFGLSGDVRLETIETEASHFQWQDLLEGHFMLLSLKTNRYVALDPGTGEPYSADSPGPRPDRKDGSVFLWSAVDGSAK